MSPYLHNVAHAIAREQVPAESSPKEQGLRPIGEITHNLVEKIAAKRKAQKP
jgi:hypothetical protein